YSAGAQKCSGEYSGPPAVHSRKRLGSFAEQKGERAAINADTHTTTTASRDALILVPPHWPFRTTIRPTAGGSSPHPPPEGVLESAAASQPTRPAWSPQFLSATSTWTGS